MFDFKFILLKIDERICVDYEYHNKNWLTRSKKGKFLRDPSLKFKYVLHFRRYACIVNRPQKYACFEAPLESAFSKLSNGTIKSKILNAK